MLGYGPWRPDAATPNSGFAVVADGVLPRAAGKGIGYGPMASLVVAAGAEALSGAPRGMISLQTFDGSWRVYAATSTTIEEMGSTYQWTDIETGRTVTTGDDVSFCHFGSYLLNSDTTDGFKAYSVEAGGTNNAVSGAPAARQIFSCSNVVVALDCDGNNRRLQSSGRGDHTAWTSKGADGKTFEDGGALICGRDLKNGAAVIFQEHAIRLMQFGPSTGDALYRIDKVADGLGSVGERSVVAFNGMCFFLATDGFYKYVAGGTPEPIGAEKVNRWYLDLVATADFPSVQGAVDPLNKVVWWRLSATVLLGYDWQLDEFFTAPASTTALTRFAVPAITYDTITGTYDSQTLTYNARALQGGEPSFGGLNADYKFSLFNGGAMAATLTTCTMNSPTKDLMRWVTPVDDATAGTLELGTAPSLNASITWGTATAKNSATDGRVQLRARGNCVAFRRNITASATWTHAIGVDHIDASQGGRK